MKKNPGRANSLRHVTRAVEGKKPGEGTGYRHGQHGERFGLKGNRNRQRVGINKPRRK